MKCNQCGAQLYNEDNFCQACGSALEMKHCPFCEHINLFAANFCGNCGLKLNPDESIDQAKNVEAGLHFASRSARGKKAGETNYQEDAIIAKTQEAASSPFIPIEPKHRTLILWGYWGFALLISFVALFNQTVGSVYVIPLLFLYLFVKLFPLIRYKPSYGWFHPLVFGSIYFSLNLFRSWTTYAFGLNNRGLAGYEPENLANIVAYSLLIMVLAELAYYAGFFWGPGFKVPKIHLFRPDNVGKKAIIVISISLLLLAAYIFRQGGIRAHLLFVSIGNSALISQGKLSGEWKLIAQLSVFSCLIWFLTDRQTSQKPVFWGITGIALVAQYLVDGSRGAVVQPLILGLLVWMLRERKIAVGMTLGLAITAITLVGVLSGFRRSAWSGEINWNLLTNANLLQGFQTGIDELRYRSAGLNPIYPILARVPNEVGLRYGQSYSALLAMPIPRAIWSAKPRGTGVLVGPVFLNTPADVPPGIIGEAYWNFHIPGVLLIFFLFGTFHQWLTVVFETYADHPAMALLYGYTIYNFIPVVHNIKLWVYSLFSFLLLLWFFDVFKLKGRGNGL